jgi:hypothetical protein
MDKQAATNSLIDKSSLNLKGLIEISNYFKRFFYTPKNIQLIAIFAKSNI